MTTAGKSSCSRRLKVCCGVSTLFLILLVVVLTTLSLTIFKPKEPKITAHPTGLENLVFASEPQVNVTIKMIISIDNPNYGGFKYKNTTACVTYHDAVVAEMPLVEEHVPARAKLNVTTTADLMVNKLISNPFFWKDFAAGCMSLNSKAVLHGHVSLLKLVKLHFKALSSCDILFFFSSRNVEPRCNTKINL